jgi:hypothetical protein
MTKAQNRRKTSVRRAADGAELRDLGRITGVRSVSLPAKSALEKRCRIRTVKHARLYGVGELASRTEHFRCGSCLATPYTFFDNSIDEF